MATEKQLAALEPGKWKPGQSGNPGGRSRKRPQSEANEDLLRSEIPPMMLAAMNKNGRILRAHATWADAIALGLGRKAVAGDSACAKELRESVEGKSVQRIELGAPGAAGFRVNVKFEVPLTAAAALACLEQQHAKKKMDVIDCEANDVDKTTVNIGDTISSDESITKASS